MIRHGLGRLSCQSLNTFMCIDIPFRLSVFLVEIMKFKTYKVNYKVLLIDIETFSWNCLRTVQLTDEIQLILQEVYRKFKPNCVRSLTEINKSCIILLFFLILVMSWYIFIDESWYSLMCRWYNLDIWNELHPPPPPTRLVV